MKFSTIILDIREQNVFFTSDTHFNHKNVNEYCGRPFESIEEMDQAIIDNWNSVVRPKDIIFHAGDFCFGSKSSWHEYLNQLNGIKYLAAGNHDLNITPDRFKDVKQIFNIRIIGDDEPDSTGQRITIGHYPMISWYQSHRGSWNLFGHAHGLLSNNKKLSPNQLDVGVDVHNFKPISYDEVKIIITKQNMKIV